MNTKDAILVVAGVAVGYLLAGYLKKSKDNSVTGTTTTTTSTGAVASAPSQATIDACNKEADDFMAMIRPSAGADLVQIRKEKFDACIASKQV
jgi:archaellin